MILDPWWWSIVAHGWPTGFDYASGHGRWSTGRHREVAVIVPTGDAEAVADLVMNTLMDRGLVHIG